MPCPACPCARPNRNKWVLTTNSLPLTFILLQLATSVLLLNALSFLSPTHPFAFQSPRWTKKTIQGVIPVCTANVVGLVFNIYCLKLVDASYFQVARGLTLPMTVVLTLVASGEKPTVATIASCGLVTWGFTYSFLPAPFLLTETGDAGVLALTHREAPVLGMVLGVASAAMVAIHAVLVKGALQSIEGKTLDLAYWQNALCAIALLPAIAVSEELGGIYRLISGTEGSLSAFAIGSGVTVSSILFRAVRLLHGTTERKDRRLRCACEQCGNHEPDCQRDSHRHMFLVPPTLGNKSADST